MDVSLEEVPADRAHVLEQLMEFCQHDYSEFVPNDIGEDGRFGYRYLPHYWREPERHPFLIRADGHIAGFVLVNGHTIRGEPGDRSIAEFFVLRAYRRHGVGTRAAHMTFARFPGRWEVCQEAENTPAQSFWRRVISDYTGDNFTVEHSDDDNWRGPILSFDNGKADHA